ncbi:MAG: flagellar motor protein MotB [bacterium]|nr:flagellar motor protein MotB [bacterium]
MAKKKHEEPESSDRWLLTYADLITLLLGLFVILYSMSVVDAEKFKAVSSALKTVFIGKPGIPAIGGSNGPYEDVEGGAYPDTSDTYLSLMVQQSVEEIEDIASELTVEIEERGVVVHLTERVMFDLGNGDLRPEARALLDKVAPVLIRSRRPISIEGHTDNLPINTALYPSNWQLSAARASNVVYFFTTVGKVPEPQISAAAYADQHPIATNGTPEGRRQNRRVDIVFMKGSWKSSGKIDGLADLNSHD